MSKVKTLAHPRGNLAIIRELHVYGKALGLGKKGEVQHKGMGKWLMEEAEKIVKKEVPVEAARKQTFNGLFPSSNAVRDPERKTNMTPGEAGEAAEGAEAVADEAVKGKAAPGAAPAEKEKAAPGAAPGAVPAVAEKKEKKK